LEANVIEVQMYVCVYVCTHENCIKKLLKMVKRRRRRKGGRWIKKEYRG
jgi:hypothetical protein